MTVLVMYINNHLAVVYTIVMLDDDCTLVLTSSFHQNCTGLGWTNIGTNETHGQILLYLFSFPFVNLHHCVHYHMILHQYFHYISQNTEDAGSQCWRWSLFEESCITWFNSIIPNSGVFSHLNNFVQRITWN